MRAARPVLSPQAVRIAHQAFKYPKVLHRVSRSVVQISRPGIKEVLGTGFVFRAHGRYWVAMPYHIGGMAGSKRMIRFTGENGEPVERAITVAVNGNAGWHAPDVSLAEFPKEDLTFVEPLPIGGPRINEPSLSFGYVAGRISAPEDILPMERRIFNSEGFGLISTREIEGEDPAQPFNVSGYCGSPVVQLISGQWRAVGLHTGSCVTEGGKPRSFAVNLSRVLPLLFSSYFGVKPVYPRKLMFRGWNLGELLPSEKVQAVEVWRNGERVLVQLMRNYPHPYSDEHSELALGDFPVLPKDEIRYEVRNNQREVRYITYKLP